MTGAALVTEKRHGVKRDDLNVFLLPHRSFPGRRLSLVPLAAFSGSHISSS